MYLDDYLFQGVEGFVRLMHGLLTHEQAEQAKKNEKNKYIGTALK